MLSSLCLLACQVIVIVGDSGFYWRISCYMRELVVSHIERSYLPRVIFTDSDNCIAEADVPCQPDVLVWVGKKKKKKEEEEKDKKPRTNLKDNRKSAGCKPQTLDSTPPHPPSSFPS